MAHRSIVSFLTHEAPPDGGAATLAQALDARVREGELIERLPDHAVRCFACGHRCLVKPGRRGICKVRFNRDGTLYVPAGYATQPKWPVILYVGRMMPQKGAKGLLDAADRVWQRLPEARFGFIGPGTPESDAWFA